MRRRLLKGQTTWVARGWPPPGEATQLGNVCLLTVDGSPSLALWWKLDGHTVFGTWWDGWLMGGLRPTDADYAIRLEEML